MRKERKHYTGDEKVAILMRHLLDKVPVSDLCEEQGLQPTVFYRWQKEFFENGVAAFQGKSRPDHQAEQQRIEFLEKDSDVSGTFYYLCSILGVSRQGHINQSVKVRPRREDSSLVATGEALDAWRGNLVEEVLAITLSGKCRHRHQGGGSGRITVDERAAKHARREGPGPVRTPFVQVRQG
jgi:transposase